MNRQKKLPYRIGTWFLVPLRTEGYALGLVARMDGRGRIFGYFFGPVISHPAIAPKSPKLKPEDAILCGRFGDLGLIDEKWIILGELNPWSAADWKMPPFIRVDERTGRGILSIYDEKTLDYVSQETCDAALIDRYPYDRDMGYGAVEIRLTKLLQPGIKETGES